MAGVDVIGNALTAQQVERYHGELQGGTAVQEQHRVILRDAHERAQVGFRLGGNGLEGFRAVAHLQHGDTAVTVIQEFLLHLPQHCRRQHRGTGTEIVDARHSIIRGELTPHRRLAFFGLDAIDAHQLSRRHQGG